ncbi:MAG: ABC transporter substrate-binding protein [Candidatus Odinarchaeia archaeon]
MSSAISSKAFLILFLMVGIGVGGGVSYAAYTFLTPQLNQQPSQYTVVDDLGNVIIITHQPERVVSLASAATITLYNLSVYDRVVGIDKWIMDPVLQEGKVICGSAYSPNIEAILNVTPDLVITWWYSEGKLDEVEAAGIPIVYIHPQSIEGILRDIELIGNVMNTTQTSNNLVALLRYQLDFMADFVDNMTDNYESPNVYIELKTEYKSCGRDTFTSEMIEFAGGVNIAANLTGYPILGDEYIINANVSIILYENEAFTESDFALRPGWDTIPAITDHKVYYLNDDIATASPRFIEGLKFMIECFWNTTLELPESLP